MSPKTKLVGFYWTYAVRWFGFPKRAFKDIHDAANHSKTLKYQRDAVQRHAEPDGEVIAHFFKIEPKPQASDAIAKQLNLACDYCRDFGALLVYVDFTFPNSSSLWRPHQRMKDILHQRGHTYGGIAPDPINGFDPLEHFKQWQQRQEQTLPQRRNDIIAALNSYRLQFPTATNADLANHLKQSELPTERGKVWDADNLRKFRREHADKLFP